MSYKVNLHITENCNYSCEHCFSKFHTKKNLDLVEWRKIVDNCLISISVKEFNIAGGEPLLHPDLLEIVQYIKEKECKCSIITNGSLVSEDWIRTYAHYFDMIGISIDSLNENTLKEIGRKDYKENVLNFEKLKNICMWIKKYNPNCKIKINTVVSKANKNENLYDDFKELSIDKWKILKMRKFSDKTFNNFHLAISDGEFLEFVRNNINQEINIEKNSCIVEMNNTKIVVEKELSGAYIIVDSNGFLINNTIPNSHLQVVDLKKDKCVEFLKNSNLNVNLYHSRYN